MHHHNKNCEQDGDEQTFGPRISFHPPSTLSSLSPSQHPHRASAASSVSPPGVWPPEVSTSRHSGKNTTPCHAGFSEQFHPKPKSLSREKPLKNGERGMLRMRLKCLMSRENGVSNSQTRWALVASRRKECSWRIIKHIFGGQKKEGANFSFFFFYKSLST